MFQSAAPASAIARRVIHVGRAYFRAIWPTLPTHLANSSGVGQLQRTIRWSWPSVFRVGQLQRTIRWSWPNVFRVGQLAGPAADQLLRVGQLEVRVGQLALELANSEQLRGRILRTESRAPQNNSDIW
jgi:hypothetical protein